MRTQRPSPRGTTLIEVMVAMAIVMFGAAGVVALQRTSNAMNGEARRATRATAFATDLLNQLQLLDYDDPRLANTSVTNDGVVGDPDGQFLSVEDPISAGIADHSDQVSADALDVNANSVDEGFVRDNGLERYWNVSILADSNGNAVEDGKLLSVIVRWRQGGGWRRQVFMASRKNPADF